MLLRSSTGNVAPDLVVGTSGVAFEGVRLQDMFLADNTSRSAPKHSVLDGTNTLITVQTDTWCCLLSKGYWLNRVCTCHGDIYTGETNHRWVPQQRVLGRRRDPLNTVRLFPQKLATHADCNLGAESPCCATAVVVCCKKYALLNVFLVLLKIIILFHRHWN